MAWLTVIALMGLCAGAVAEDKTRPGQPGSEAGSQAGDDRRGRKTGLKLPRFVSLRTGEVNVRSGPGKRYPILWVFRRRHLPVEITAEFDVWRKIRDWQGAVGWLHQAALVGRRTVLVTGRIRTLRRRPNPDARAVARLEPGVTGRLRACRGAWCRVEVEGYRGWLRRGDIYGVYANETVE